MPRNLNNITQTNGYTITKPNVKQEWSSVYMAKTNQGTGYCGKIIPVYTRELVPGQTIDLQQDIAIQFTPFLTNLFHEIKGELITYFVPYRICAFMRQTETIDEEVKEEADQLKWESFITGGKNGQDNQKLDFSINLKRAKRANGGTLIGTLADYFGIPTHDLNYNYPESGVTVGEEWTYLNALPWNAYNLIYNTKLRNPDFTPWKRMQLTNSQGTTGDNQTKEINDVATAYWNADRFTRARAMQQRGIAPNIPINSTLIELAHQFTREGLTPTGVVVSETTMGSTGVQLAVDSENQNDKLQLLMKTSTDDDRSSDITLEKHTIPAGTITAELNLNEFLYDLGILQYEANMARIKPRYTDFLNSQFGIIPEDSRFQEPEWLSSNSFAIGIDTNSATATGEYNAGTTENPDYIHSRQGEITSQAWGGGRKMKTKYKALEHGLVMTLMIIRPLGVYEGGLERYWDGRRTRFSFPLPETVNLPDQKIYHSELYMDGRRSEDTKLFGWEAIHDQYRTETNQVCGLLRPSEQGGLASYTLARYFANGIEGTIDDSFLKCNPNMERIKQYINQPDFIFFVRTENRTAMPIPLINQPINLGIN